MRLDGGGGLTVDAEVRRGDFTLTVGLAAAAGQVVGVLGPNGAGKSTLLSAVAGLTPVSAGRITLAGQVMDDASTGAFVEPSGRPVGFVFQNYRLFPYLTVAENVAFSPRVRGLGRRAAKAAAGHWLDRLGLNDLAGCCGEADREDEITAPDRGIDDQAVAAPARHETEPPRSQ